VKARIDAGGRTVELDTPDTGTSIRELADKALEVWQATAGAHTGPGPAVGFASERRERTMAPGPAGGYGEGYMREVRAEAGT